MLQLIACLATMAYLETCILMVLAITCCLSRQVGMWGEDKSTALCSVAGSPPASVVFKTELGNIPLLSVATSIGVSIEVTEEVEGTKLNIECSGHGHCDATIGECVCFDGWASSDGDGAVGHRLDCGWSPGEAGILIDS